MESTIAESTQPQGLADRREQEDLLEVDVPAQRFQRRGQWFGLHAATVELLDKSLYPTIDFAVLPLQGGR
jgi:hypothetical protein